MVKVIGDAAAGRPDGKRGRSQGYDCSRDPDCGSWRGRASGFFSRMSWKGCWRARCGLQFVAGALLAAVSEEVGCYRYLLLSLGCIVKNRLFLLWMFTARPSRSAGSCLRPPVNTIYSQTNLPDRGTQFSGSTYLLCRAQGTKWPRTVAKTVDLCRKAGGKAGQA